MKHRSRIGLVLALLIALSLLPAGGLAFAAEGTSANPQANTATTKASRAKGDAQNQKPSKKAKQKVIVIDAGHQKQGMSGKEPIGPGARQRKMKVTWGTTGCATRVPEYKLTLQVAKRLQKELVSRGYKVIMVRTKHNVRISNAQRAKIANRAKADAFIRIHANSSDSSSVKGALTIAPTSKNKYMAKKNRARSYALSKQVLKHMCKTTGAKNRGVWRTDTMTGINWCKVPVTIVEMGFMSNPTEDRKMQKASYQKKIVTGIANGIDAYFKRE